jgi:hypothetical protein
VSTSIIRKFARKADVDILMDKAESQNMAPAPPPPPFEGGNHICERFAFCQADLLKNYMRFCDNIKLLFAILTNFKIIMELNQSAIKTRRKYHKNV